MAAFLSSSEWSQAPRAEPFRKCGCVWKPTAIKSVCGVGKVKVPLEGLRETVRLPPPDECLLASIIGICLVSGFVPQREGDTDLTVYEAAFGESLFSCVHFWITHFILWLGKSYWIKKHGCFVLQSFSKSFLEILQSDWLSLILNYKEWGQFVSIRGNLEATVNLI